jgi:hypothetical protein
MLSLHGCLDYPLTYQGVDIKCVKIRKQTKILLFKLGRTYKRENCNKPS